MTNRQMIQAATLEQTSANVFILTHWVDGRAFVSRINTGHIDDAIAYINTFFQIDLMWVQHVTRDDLWICIGVEE